MRIDLSGVEVTPPRRFIDCQDISWVVGGMLAVNGITVLAGDAGEGKTTLALQLSHCIQTGTPFLRQPVERGNVLFVSQDESPEDVKDKIVKMVSKCPSLNRLEYHAEYFTPLSPDRVIKLAAASQGYSVLVIDSLGAIDAGNVNNADDMTRCMKVLRDIARYNRLAILLLHHLRKPGGERFETTEERVAGSYAIRASCDRMLNLYSQGGQTVLAPERRKFRGRRTFKKLILDWDSYHLIYRVSEVVLPEEED